ncbi:hypothetical protein NNA36_16055 [Shimia sp. CNT1-13L.2]|uniref:hypothetical protein n=1 Tax=Shimia sp. CNT1-13L.2 TaxID=2959663 RepID=UPI0020CDE3F3|nr:hypothetical protein [Shimia sp. CNT1-13L.2]MCP9483476.1 hypothetical protein [Shimia sp. CNT1-13L.2]
MPDEALMGVLKKTDILEIAGEGIGQSFVELALLQSVVLEQSNRIDLLEEAVRKARSTPMVAKDDREDLAIKLELQSAQLAETQADYAQLAEALSEKERQRFALELELCSILTERESVNGMTSASGESSSEMSEMAQIVREQEELILSQGKEINDLRRKLTSLEAGDVARFTKRGAELLHELIGRIEPVLNGYRTNESNLIAERDQAILKGGE